MDRPNFPPVVAIVGGGSLLGRELGELLSETKARFRVKLIGADENEAGSLTEQGGEPLIMTELDEENLAEAAVVFLAGSENSSRRALQIVSRAGASPVIVDVTNALEGDPKAALRAPVVEPRDFHPPLDVLHVVAHPAAIALALFLSRLHQKFPIRRSVINAFEPASERGKRGIDELQQQTVNLLTFKNLPKDVFDEQAGFNLLSRYGSEAPEALEKFESRIERHLAALLAQSGTVPMPSVRLIQAPVFHGHSFSAWVEFEANPGTQALEAELATTQIDVRGPDVEAPTNVGIAGQGGIAVGGIRPDRNEPRAAWFWVVADNLRLTAENALMLARALLPEGGSVQ